MHAVVCSRFDGIDALEWREIPDPVPGPKDVLVEVHAAALSFMDTLVVSGRYQMKPDLPFVPGTDAAGVVLAVGSEVRHVQIGDRVACSYWQGGMAELMVAPAAGVVKLPGNVGFVVGATVRYAYGTARYALEDRTRLQAGEVVFVSGAAGGVGLAAVDLARSMGARIIAGVGSTGKARAAIDQGAAEVIVYGVDPVRERLLAITDGRGVDVYFDTVGGSLLAPVSRAMAWDGRILVIGFAGGEIPSLAMNLPLLKNYSVVGCHWGPWAQREPQLARAADERLFAAVARGELRPRIAGVLLVEAYAEGLHRLARREVVGRLVLAIRPGDDGPHVSEQCLGSEG